MPLQRRNEVWQSLEKVMESDALSFGEGAGERCFEFGLRKVPESD